MNTEEALKVLGLYSITDMSQEELKKKYKMLMIKYHPDNTGGDDNKAKEISIAFKIINDTLTKMNYVEEKNKSICISLDNLISIYNGKTIRNSKNNEISLSNIYNFNTLIDIKISVKYNNKIIIYSETVKIRKDREFNIACNLQVSKLGQAYVKVKVYNMEKEITINYDSMAVKFNLGNDLKINVKIDKKLTSKGDR